MAQLEASRDGAVLTLTFARPEVRNALSRQVRHELGTALASAAADESVRAVILTGQGQSFCAGLDLSELQDSLTYTPEQHRADTRALADLFLQMVHFPKPLLAAVAGHAVAGGAGLVTACDVAIMADDAKIGYTESRIGFVAALVSVLLVRQVGQKQARDLLLTARLISAAEALGMGLVNEVLPRAEVMARTRQIADQMVSNAPNSLRLTKQLLAGVDALSLEQGMDWAVEVNTEARTGSELGEGVRAFLEKREPSWR